MSDGWNGAQRAYCQGADWFVGMVDRVADRWEQPGLGEWDVRALVGHTSRALTTIETYLSRPAPGVDVECAADYYRAGRGLAGSAAVTERGREAGAALGDDPVSAVGQIAERVLALVGGRDGSEVIHTVLGGMRLRDYLPTRTFELTVHTADLAVALGEPLVIPPEAARESLAIAAELALDDGAAGPLLLAVTGRTALPDGYSLI